MATVPASERDFQTLQGTWRQIAFEENGLVEPPDSLGANGALTTIDGDHFKVHTVAGDLLLQGRLTLV